MQVDILSLTDAPLSEEVRGVIVPAEDGYLEILHHHAPLFSKLGKGKITLLFEHGDRVEIVVAQEGLVKVNDNKVVILLN